MRSASAGIGSEPSGPTATMRCCANNDGGAGTHRHLLGIEQVGVLDHDRTGGRRVAACVPAPCVDELPARPAPRASHVERVLPAFAHERRKAVERREQFTVLVEPDAGGLEPQAADRIQADLAGRFAVADLQLRQLLQVCLTLRQQGQLAVRCIAQCTRQQPDFLERSGLADVERCACDGLGTAFDLVLPGDVAACAREAFGHRALEVVIAVGRDGHGDALRIELDLRCQRRPTSTIVEREMDDAGAVGLQADRLVTRAIAHQAERVIAARPGACRASNGLRHRNRSPYLRQADPRRTQGHSRPSPSR